MDKDFSSPHSLPKEPWKVDILPNTEGLPPVFVKADQGKSRWDLLPFRATEQIVKVVTFGATKYGPDNWRNNPQHERFVSATFRHLYSWITGEKNDPESGLSHLAHAMCNLMFLLECEIEQRGTNGLSYSKPKSN